MDTGDRLMPLIRRRTWRDRDPLPGLLREWHGSDLARGEVLSRLPHEIPVSEAVEQVLCRVISPDELRLRRLREEWAAVVGAPIARVSEPHHLHKGVLYVMVRGAAMRMELTRFQAAAILAKIHHHSGEDFCREIRFAAED